MACEPEVVAALSLGGNQGDVEAAFRAALATFDATPGVEIMAQSSLWRTPPWGKTDQPDFLNMAALARSRLPARALLEVCLSIERQHGRARIERWGPRTLDIDIVDYGGQTIVAPDLILPHPRATERAFVLAPLAEIAPDILLAGENVGAHLARIGSCGARRLGPLPRQSAR